MAGKHIDMNIEDALIEKPHCFTIDAEGKGGRHFYLFPVTLGKVHLLKRHIENLGINLDNLKTQPYLEALRVVRGHKEEICRIITYHTFKRKRDIFDYEQVERRTAYFLEHLSDEDASSMFILLLTRDNVEDFMQHLGITKENERMRKIVEAKKKAQKSQNDFSFGGKSVYGSLIDAACERYGWTYDYVLWGISLTNLQMMLADKIQDIYLSDDERKKVRPGLLNGEDSIDADDTSNREKILQMDWR